MKHVLTVHGINTTGSWQALLEDELRHHFVAKSIKYDHYRRILALRIVLEPYVLFATLSVVLLVQVRVLDWATAIRLGAVLLTAAIGAAWYVRWWTVRWFKRQVDPFVRPGQPPHVIAHSFGTYLVGSAIRTFPDLRFNCVVLSGCVLPHTYEWHDILKRNPFAFSQIRNEVGRKDWVVWTVYVVRDLLPGLLPGLGYSGIAGFAERSDLVHTTSFPYGPCELCTGTPVRPFVHNVDIPEFTHSDAFIGSNHIRTFWLPFLWGIEAGEYEEFLRMCTLAAHLEDEDDRLNLRLTESELRETPWRWAGGLSLGAYIRKRLEGGSTVPVRDEDVDEVIRWMWNAVRDARRETEEVDTAYQRGEVVRALRPSTAVLRAIANLA